MRAMSVAVHASLGCNQRAGSEMGLSFYEFEETRSKGYSLAIFLCGLLAVVLLNQELLQIGNLPLHQ